MQSLSQTDRTRGEIDWPAWATRTPPADRKRTSKYKVTQTQALKRLRKELLDRVGADDWRLSTAAPHRKKDGLPYADARPDDPGVVVRWTKDGEQYCVACDRYTDVRSNARTIGLYVAEKRKMSDRPVRTGQDEFATARLPPGEDEDATVASAGQGGSMTTERAADVLGVTPSARAETVRGAYRELVKAAHGDQGGDRDLDVSELQRARDELLRRDDD